MCRIVFLFTFSFLTVVAQAKAASQTELIFPIYAFTNTENCRFWSSGVSLFNPNSTVTTVTFNGFDKNGNVIDSRSVSIDPFTSAAFSLVRTNVHWLKATSSEPVLAKEILQVIKCPPDNLQPGTLAIADVLTMLDLAPAARERHYFVQISFNELSGLNTGLAIVFPAASVTIPAKGKLIHRGPDGLKITEKDIVIPANGQVAGMVSELLSESLKVSNTISGSLEDRKSVV